MNNKTISSWIRQARHRAKKHNIYSDLEIDDIIQIITQDNKCAYCQNNDPNTLDHPFPIKDHAPNIPANVVQVCKECKNTKKNNDLIWMFSSGIITESRYLELLSQLFSRRGGETMKNYVRQLSGYGGGNE